MKKLLLISILLFCSSLAFAGNDYYANACNAGNISTCTWNTTSTGSCLASGGTALTFASRVAGDALHANGCASITVDVDPGTGGNNLFLTNSAAAVATGGINGAGTGGGTFAVNTSLNITLHATVIAGGVANPAITLTGSTNGVTITGPITAGSISGANGVSDTHTAVLVTVSGAVTGGTIAGAVGYNSTSSGPVTISGIVSAGTGGIGFAGASTAAVSIDTCQGADSAIVIGCNASGSGTITVTNRLIFGKKSTPIQGPMLFTPGATGYILIGKNSSYVGGTVDANATEAPTDPGIANVRNGTAYGTFTGTLATSGNNSGTAN